MLKFTFDHNVAYRAVIYARMSSDRQNPRSPDQQIDTINHLVQNQSLPWTIVKTYRDDGVSGRYSRKRPQYRQMISDLKSGRVDAQLILVDTFERLSRASDAAIDRQKLEREGVLVLTADTRFGDPTSGAGQAMASFEALRARQDGEIKAHNVLRGKRDAVRRKQWPGGPIPTGYRLKNVMVTVKGVEEIAHRVLEPDPQGRTIIEQAFRLADQKGWGGDRIAQNMNADESIPERFKPFNPSTTSNWLSNPIYLGRYEWGKFCTGIVDDVRVLQENPEEDWERIEDYCEPIIAPDTWNRVRAIREKRKRSAPVEDCIVQSPCPRAVGVSLKYPLSGLVRCDHCGRAMVANGCAPYLTASGESRRYTAYACLGHNGGGCENAFRVPEQWLRETVFSLVRDRLLFSPDGAHEGMEAASSPQASATLHSGAVTSEELLRRPEFQELVLQVNRELQSLVPEAPDRVGSLTTEKEELEQHQSGWLQSLGNPNLSASIRREIEAEFTVGKERIESIDAEMRQISAREASRRKSVEPELVAERLAQLADVLSGQNASATNVILSQHIESIRCDSDRRVVVRSCKLGCVAEDLHVFQPNGDSCPESPNVEARGQTIGRRRTRRQLRDTFDDEDAAAEANDFAVDLERFAGLGSEWFCEDIFVVPKRQSWAEGHAEKVARFRLETHATMAATAEHFGKTVPTIRKALVYARDQHGLDAFGKSISQPNRVTWPQQHAEAVREFFSRPGATMKAAAKHFSKSEPTIRKARDLARAG